LGKRSNPLAKFNHAPTGSEIYYMSVADRRNPQIYMPVIARSKASKNSAREAGRRIDAYLLGMASGRRFSSRVLEIASGLLSLRVKAKDLCTLTFAK
jgi:hypothetical protein